MIGYGVNKSTRKRVVELLTEKELADSPVSGDFAGEGILDYFRKAEIWVPTEIYADFVRGTDLDWYAIQFSIGFLPPEKQKISVEIKG